MKAVSQLIGGALLIAIVLTTASILMQWTTIFSEKETEEIKTETENELLCQYAELYISNVKYDCNILCEGGSCVEADHHNITYNISNLGSITFSIDEILIRNTTGHLFIYNISETQISPGNTTSIIAENKNKLLNNTIQEFIIASKNCPKTARDVYPGDYINYVNC